MFVSKWEFRDLLSRAVFGVERPSSCKLGQRSIYDENAEECRRIQKDAHLYGQPHLKGIMNITCVKND